MIKKISLSLIGLLLAGSFIGPTAFGQSKFFAIGGGISKTFGKSGRNDIQFRLKGVGTSFFKLHPNIYIGGKIVYYRWIYGSEQMKVDINGSKFSSTMSIMQLVPMVRFMWDSNPQKPTNYFVQFGFGAYKSKTYVAANYKEYWVKETVAVNNSGMNLGGGVLISNFKGTQFELNPAIDIVFGNKETTVYFSTSLGVVFNFRNEIYQLFSDKKNKK